MNENRNNLPMNPAQLRQREHLEQKNKAVEKMQRQQEVLERENKAAEKMQRQQERFERKSTAAAQKTLRQIRELSHKPDAIEPFLETLENIFSDRKDVQRPQGIPTIGTFCVMVPPEIIYAQEGCP
jgi:hypothetical protein